MANLVLWVNDVKRDFASLRIRPRNLGVSYDSPRSFEFSEHGKAHFHPTFNPGMAVELWVDTAEVSSSSSSGAVGERWFYGKIESRELVGDPNNEHILYKCLGPRHGANRVKVRDPNAVIEQVVFNMPPEDPDYNANFADLTVGEILKELFDTHRAELQSEFAAPQSGDDPYYQVELDRLDTVPYETVTLTNYGFADAVQDLLEFHPDFFFFINPEDLMWHFLELEGMPQATITLAADRKVVQSLISESTEGAFTSYIIRGRKEIQNKVFSVADGTLLEHWTGSLNTSWNLPKGYGANAPGESTPTSSDSVSVTDTTQSWTVNEWQGGIVVLVDNTQLTSEAREVASNTATKINWDYPTTVTADEYRVWKPEHDENWWVYRRYRPANADDRRIALRADPPLWVPGGAGLTGDALLSSRPMIVLKHDLPPVVYVPMPVTVAKDGSYVVTPYPTVRIITVNENLWSEGSQQEPDDILLFAPVFRDPLTTRAPQSGYTGSAFDRFNIQRTKSEHIPRWRNPANAARFETLAHKKLKAYKDVFYRGQIPLAEIATEFHNLGYRINVAAACAYEGSTTTNLESASILLREVRYEWNDQSPIRERTTLVLNNDIREYRGESELGFESRFLEFRLTFFGIGGATTQSQFFERPEARDLAPGSGAGFAL